MFSGSNHLIASSVQVDQRQIDIGGNVRRSDTLVTTVDGDPQLIIAVNHDPDSGAQAQGIEVDAITGFYLENKQKLLQFSRNEWKFCIAYYKHISKSFLIFQDGDNHIHRNHLTLWPLWKTQSPLTTHVSFLRPRAVTGSDVDASGSDVIPMLSDETHRGFRDSIRT